MATAKLKRKPRLSKIESYKSSQVILKKCSFASNVLCRFAHRYIYILHTRLLLLVVLGGHVDSTGCLGASKCQGLGSSRRFAR